MAKKNKIIKMPYQRAYDLFNFKSTKLKDTIEAKYSTTLYNSCLIIVKIIKDIVKNNDIFILDLTSNIGGDLNCFISNLNYKLAYGFEINSVNYKALYWNFNIMHKKDLSNKKLKLLNKNSIKFLKNEKQKLIFNNKSLATHIFIIDPPWGGRDEVAKHYKPKSNSQSLYFYKEKEEIQTTNKKYKKYYNLIEIINFILSKKINDKFIIYLKVPFTFNLVELIQNTKNISIYPYINIKNKYLILIISNYKVDKKLIKNFGFNLQIKLPKLNHKYKKDNDIFQNNIKKLMSKYAIDKNQEPIIYEKLYQSIDKFIKSNNNMNYHYIKLFKLFQMINKLITLSIIFDKNPKIIKTNGNNFNNLRKIINDEN